MRPSGRWPAPAAAHYPSRDVPRKGPAVKLNARLAAVAAVALATAGCSAVNPITTQEPYDASDGISVEIGEIKGLNIMVVTEAEGSPAVLLGSLNNPTDEDVTVAISLDGESGTDVDVPAGSTVKLGGESEEAHVTGTSTAAPGLFAEVLFVTEAYGQLSAEAPVMDGTLPEYQLELDALG